MDPTENLRALHAHEEEIRAKSLAAIERHPALRDHWAIVAEAVNIIYAVSHDYEHQSDDELTLQFLGIRQFNAAATTIKLALGLLPEGLRPSARRARDRLTSAAALIGLLFIVSSLHLDETVNNPAFRLRARNNTIHLVVISSNQC